MPLLALVVIDLPARQAAERGVISHETKILSRLGLATTLPGAKSRATLLPSGSWAGCFPGRGAQAAERLQVQLTEAITEAFESAGLVGSILVVCAGHWSWHVRPLPRTRTRTKSPAHPPGIPSGAVLAPSRVRAH